MQELELKGMHVAVLSTEPFVMCTCGVHAVDVETAAHVQQQMSTANGIHVGCVHTCRLCEKGLIAVQTSHHVSLYQ